MNIFNEFTIILKDFERQRIEYALVGGVAMAFYAEPRFTQDIDLLIGPDDLEKIRQILGENGYVESAAPWTFKSTPLTLHRFLKALDDDQMIMDILIAGEEKHFKIIENALIAQSEEGEVRLAEKSDLIWLKNKRKSLQDRADVERLKNEED
jgi:hypothetical protein